MKLQESLGVGDVAKELNFSRTYIQYLTDTNRLNCSRTSSGRRVFKQEDLQEFRRRRRRELLRRLRAVG
jgi:DNA-binding transcriptional MerR regulator